MKKHASFIILSILSAAAACQNVRAGNLTDHTKVWIGVAGSSPVGTHNLPELVGADHAALAYEGTGTGNGTQHLYASAATSASAAGLIRLETRASSEHVTGSFMHASARADASWADVVTYHGDSTPDYLTLSFRVSGSLGGSAQYSQAGIKAVFAPTTSLDVVSHSGSVFNHAGDFYVDLEDGQLHVGPGFRDVSFDAETGSFTGTMTYKARYDSKYDGYVWHLTVMGAASGGEHYRGLDGWASMEFGHTISLTSLSLPDGTPLSDSDVSFDSGLTLASVPEPSSLALLVTGLAAGGIVLARRRGRGSLDVDHTIKN